MRYQYTTLLLAALTTFVTANFNLRANYIPQLFNERTVRPAGGWAVGLNPDETCPNLIGTAQSCGPRWCCPPDLVCHPKNATDIAAACCPAGIDCVSAFQATPYCANANWSLWNATSDSNDTYAYFCCAAGQVGLQTGDCIAADKVSSPTQMAVEVASGSTATASTSTSSGTTASATAASTTTSSTASSTSSGAVTTKSSSAQKDFKGIGAGVVLQVLGAGLVVGLF